MIILIKFDIKTDVLQIDTGHENTLYNINK